MNWVGGSRSRLVMKSDTKKQREFFEKRKLQKRLIKSGITLPSSPGDTNTGSGSMDLVTLFIVNQIAAKKENKDVPKVPVLCRGRRGSRQAKNPLVLPMSPCSPSQLSLVEGQPQCSGQGKRKKSHAIPQDVKCRQLSPVLESAFSDNSASDYRMNVTNPLSPFSSASSVSSGPGMFPLTLNLQQRGQAQTQPPSPWNNSGLEQIKFQPFSQPRGMTDNFTWSCASNPLLHQLETPTAAQVLFGNPDPEVTEARHEQPMMNFILNQSECKQQFEEDVFRGFSNEDNEKEDFHIGSLKSKIYLNDDALVESSAPQTVPESQCMGMELSNCGDTKLSFPGQSGSMKDCGYSPSFSCSGYYFSSDSDDDEDYCPPCLQPSASSYVQPVRSVDTSDQGSQVQPKQRPRPLTPLMKPKTNITVHEKGTEMLTYPEQSSGSNAGQRPNTTAQAAASGPQLRPLNAELCKCQKPSNKTQDAGTQTVTIPAAEMCDASTQCTFTTDGGAPRHPVFNVHLPPPGLTMQHAATGGQTDTAAQPNTHPASTGKRGSTKKPKADSLPRNRIFLEIPINCFPDATSVTDAKGKEIGRQETSLVMTDHTESEREEEVTSPSAGELLRK